MIKLLESIFVIFLSLSLLTALILVFSQLMGLLIGNGELMLQMNDMLLTPAIVSAAIFSGVAFILGYTNKYKDN